ncbi:hypothetical protein BDB01DRAFT_725354 [Pilobolus umbonatus]|nr:hypothetical protein BDB01DRAFT_725354 [Pilobolus umbonatus]
MDWLENQLKSLIEKTVSEYESVATQDPKVESAEDGTLRGEVLDKILESQEAERKRLWQQLQKLEDERVSKQQHRILMDIPETDPLKKALLTYMHESHDITQEITKQMKKVNIITRVEDTVIELQFREDLDKKIGQFIRAVDYIKEERRKVEEKLKEETRVLEECQEVHEALREKERSLNLGPTSESLQMRLRELQVSLQKKFQEDSDDLVDFLDQYYPPHPVDGAGPMGDECEIKTILEELMNQAFLNPDNPYIMLTPGTYWTPYIETLVKAGLVSYSPDDSTQICLEDFRY